VQLGLDTGRSGALHREPAGALAPLRDEGVLILGSGNIVHNLRLSNPDEPEPPAWAARWEEEIKKRIVAGDHEALASPDTLGPDARLAVPTPEHYLALLGVLALRDAGRAVHVLQQRGAERDVHDLGADRGGAMRPAPGAVPAGRCRDRRPGGGGTGVRRSRMQRGTA
jgi:aromatic ring-opening dioxygenase catalytic subunit (LigB family)